MFANRAPATKLHDRGIPLLICYFVAHGTDLRSKKKKDAPYSPVRFMVVKLLLCSRLDWGIAGSKTWPKSRPQNVLNMYNWDRDNGKAIRGVTLSTLSFFSCWCNFAGTVTF